MFHQLAVAIFVAAVAVPAAAALITGELATRYLAAAPGGLLLASGRVALGQRIFGDLREISSDASAAENVSPGPTRRSIRALTL